MTHIALIGDRSDSVLAHRAIPLALEQARANGAPDVAWQWLATRDLKNPATDLQNCIDDRAIGRDIAAHHAKTLGERALDDVDPLHQPVALGDAAAARTVHADRVHFVDIGERAELFGEVADLPDRRHVAIHRIHALDGDELLS